jgi:RNA 2',3'-cyclic 3'-phosphodiesterase
MSHYLIAIPLPKTFYSSLRRLSFGLPNVDWIEPENNCIQLRFLGQLDGVVIKEVTEQLKELVFSPFYIQFNEIKVLSEKNRGVLTLSLHSNLALQQLLSSIERNLKSLSVENNPRSFHPHLVLGYFEKLKDNKLAEYLHLYSNPLLPSCEVRKIVLMSFHRTQKQLFFK